MRQLLLALGILALLAGAAHAATPREETQSYGPDVILKYYCDVDDTGAGCFALDGSENEVTITIEDATGIPVQVSYTFIGADGSFLSEGDSCEAVTVPVPDGAVWLDVWPSPFGVLDGCEPGVPTTGTITAAFT